jgi:hypothetical protein
MSDDATIDRRQDPPKGETPPESDDSAVDSMERCRLWLLVALVLGLVVLADWLFWDCPRGWTVGAYGLLLTGTLCVWEQTFRRNRVVVLVTLAIALLFLQCVEEPNRLAVGCGVLGLVTLAIMIREGWSTNAVTWMQRWALLAATGWRAFFKDVATWYRSGQRRVGLARSGTSLFGNWFLPVLLGAVFLALFVVANPVMSRWLGDVWGEIHRLLEQLTERFPSRGRILMWVLTALALWALLRFRSGVGPSSPGEGASIDADWAGFPKPPLIIRCLVLFNLLFALQTGLDLYYLWGGGELPKGLTYAQYAHRGAYPLLVAAILAALFVLAAFRADPRESSMRVARRLVYIWLMQNLFLVVSAAWRLRLYIDAYTLTRWRVAAVIWMLLVFCGILWILVRIITGRSNLWLVNVNTATALLVLYVCCFLNFDGWIAHFNVIHCREVRGSGPKIDLAYLESLGPDTLPALRQLAGKTRGARTALAVHQTIERLRTDLQADLASWRGWTWRRQRLGQLEYPGLPPEPIARE